MLSLFLLVEMAQVARLLGYSLGW